LTQFWAKSQSLGFGIGDAGKSSRIYSLQPPSESFPRSLESPQRVPWRVVVTTLTETLSFGYSCSIIEHGSSLLSFWRLGKSYFKTDFSMRIFIGGGHFSRSYPQAVKWNWETKETENKWSVGKLDEEIYRTEI